MNLEEKIAVLSFYSFVSIKDVNMLLPKILYIAKKKYIRGTVLIAHEGFNGTISGSLENVQLLLKEIEKLTNAKDINAKINYCKIQPFSKIKVKIKNEIVALKYKDNFDVENLKGQYIETHDWDDFICQKDVITIDTRNDYEIKIGTFKNSINPQTETFKQLPEWTDANIDHLKGKKVAMFCTGGIRCEKSTALLKDKGIKEVYHLKGGILQYLEDTKNKNKMWQGECFVFDDRGAVAEDLSPAKNCWVKRGYTAKSMAKLASN
ncbi:MAG: rhodanese domain-containing protein [Rickettsiaceae bacterium]|nr:rhodanese domain-containing protein [Rickettsiaceae bacterium]